MDFSRHIEFPETLFVQELDGEIVLLDMESENYFGLDSVATDIWYLLQKGLSLNETTSALLEIYDVEEERARQDLERFINHLLENGLGRLV